jgi:hypothetical protein
MPAKFEAATALLLVVSASPKTTIIITNTEIFFIRPDLLGWAILPIIENRLLLI